MKIIDREKIKCPFESQAYPIRMQEITQYYGEGVIDVFKFKCPVCGFVAEFEGIDDVL